MNRQSQLKHVLLVTVFGAATTVVAGAATICQTTSQDALNACQKAAQGDFLNASAMCINDTASRIQQKCIQDAKTNFQDALTTCQDQFTTRNQICQKVGQGAYDPKIDPSDFSTIIDNPFLPMKPGTTLVYAGPTSTGFIRNTVAVTNDTLVIDGVKTVIVHDQVFTDGELTEDTLDHFAQDDNGTVWYFGEDSEELTNGRVSSIDGSWVAGVDEARPGIIMGAHPKIGDFHRQEFLIDVAEDVGGTISLDETVTVPAGTFHHCIETEEVTGLEPGALEHKFFAPGVGNVLTIDLVTGDRFPLVQIIN